MVTNYWPLKYTVICRISSSGYGEIYPETSHDNESGMLLGTLKHARTAETVVNFGVAEPAQGLIGYIPCHKYHVDT